jgi:hypothetical protein
MKATQRIFKSTIIGASILGIGLLSSTTAVLAGSQMPSGYTLSKTQLKGQYCYRHNNESSLYCYPSRLTQSSMMKKGDSMMKKDDSMMKKDDSMMKKGDSMMKKDDSMMKKDDSMMKKGQ